MADAHLTGDQRAALRQFTVLAAHGNPALITRGTQIADQLRAAFPGLADESIACVLDAVTDMAITYGHASGCGHVISFAQLISAAMADLAHLDMP